MNCSPVIDLRIVKGQARLVSTFCEFSKKSPLKKQRPTVNRNAFTCIKRWHRKTAILKRVKPPTGFAGLVDLSWIDEENDPYIDYSLLQRLPYGAYAFPACLASVVPYEGEVIAKSSTHGQDSCLSQTFTATRARPFFTQVVYLTERSWSVSDYQSILHFFAISNPFSCILFFTSS